MSTVASPSSLKLTAADLLAMPDEKDYELVSGRLEVKNVVFDSSWIAMSLVGFLASYCREMNLGWILGPDAGFQCFPDDPQKVRKPDVSFISLAKIPTEHSPMGFIPTVPDLAVEVVSPNDLADEISDKVHDYLAAGVTLVWVIYPLRSRIEVYRSTGSKTLSSQDELLGE